MDMYGQIRKMYLEGYSQRRIAAVLQISRNTVKKYCKGEQLPGDRAPYKREASVLTPEVTEFIRKCLEEDQESGTGKQQHTARRIYIRLVEETGFKGAESTVRQYVRELKDKAAEAFVPLAYPRGDAVQIDWGTATVYIKDEKMEINLFCARLCYSGAPFAAAYRKQNTESFLDALVRMFNYFGGVPKHVIFDNARVAVKQGYGRQAKAQDKYKALASHYGFEPVFCNPASGNEKGLVEGLVGYIRRNVCVPVPKVDDMAELNEKLLENCKRYLQHRIRSKPAPVGNLLAEERDYLYPLPAYAYDPSTESQSQVSRNSTVRFDNNNYSVPVDYCGKAVTVKAAPETVRILYCGKVIAEHSRCYEREKNIYSMEHYLPLLERKPRAIPYAKPVQDHVSEEFISWLSKQDLTPRQLVQLLHRCSEAGCEAVMSGIITKQETDIKDPVIVQKVDLSPYDTLCSRKSGAA